MISQAKDVYFYCVSLLSLTPTLELGQLKFDEIIPVIIKETYSIHPAPSQLHVTVSIQTEVEPNASRKRDYPRRTPVLKQVPHFQIIIRHNPKRL